MKRFDARVFLEEFGSADTKEKKMRRIFIAMAAVVLMTGTMAVPVAAAPPKIITVSWIETAYRYSHDGTLQFQYAPSLIGPLDLLQTGKAYHDVSISDFYSIPVSYIKGSLTINGAGMMSAEVTYIREDTPLLTLRDRVNGRVALDPVAGTMIGHYIQYRKAYGSKEDVLASFPYAIPDKSPTAGG
jgi:hypothetical protein